MYLKHELLSNLNDWEQYFTEKFDELVDLIPDDGDKELKAEWRLKIRKFRTGRGLEDYPMKRLDCEMNPFASTNQLSLVDGEKRGLTKLYHGVRKAERMIHNAENKEDIKKVKDWIKEMQGIRKKAFDDAKAELELYYPLYRESIEEASKNSLSFKQVWQKKSQQHIQQLKSSPK